MVSYNFFAILQTYRRKKSLGSIAVKSGEPLDNAVRRFKRLCEKMGLSKELRKRQYHIKASKLKQRDKAAAKKRLLKRLSRDRFAPQNKSAHERRR